MAGVGKVYDDGGLKTSSVLIAMSLQVRGNSIALRRSRSSLYDAAWCRQEQDDSVETHKGTKDVFDADQIKRRRWRGKRQCIKNRISTFLLFALHCQYDYQRMWFLYNTLCLYDYMAGM